MKTPVSRPRMITLTSDFGLKDAYVGVMKGVILGRNPYARLVDLTHAVPPGDIRAAAFLLAGATPFFPEGSIHLAVVDPGVGSTRRGVAIRTRRGFYVGPDNGVFALALRRDPARQVVHLVNPKHRLPDVSDTFHGRDIFAPVAAAISRGVPLRGFGPAIDDLLELDIPKPVATAGGKIEAAVIHVDHFGNCITNLPESLLRGKKPLTIHVRHRCVGGLVRTYSDVSRGGVAALVGSSGYVEIAIRDGHAARRLGLRVGSKVQAQRRD